MSFRIEPAAPLRHALVSQQQVINKQFSVAFPAAMAAIMAFSPGFGKDRRCIAMSPCDPAEEICYYEPGFLLKDGDATDMDLAGHPSLHLRTLREGVWGVFTHRGSYEGLFGAWQNGFTALKTAGYKLDGVPFEEYVNSMKDTATDDLVTEIWFPCVKA